MKDKNHMEESAWIHQMQVMLDKLDKFYYDEITILVEKGGAVNI